MKIVLPLTDSELLTQCEVQTFRSSGSGGQHVNTTDSAVRLKHLPSNIIVSSQKERSQHLNKLDCIKKLRKIVERLNYKAPKRIPTKPSKKAKEDRFKEKKHLSAKKQNRIKISMKDL